MGSAPSLSPTRGSDRPVWSFPLSLFFFSSPIRVRFRRLLVSAHFKNSPFFVVRSCLLLSLPCGRARYGCVVPREEELCRAQWTGGGSARSGCRRRSGRHRPRGARASRPALHPRGGARPGAMPAGDLPTLARGDPCRRLAARQKRCTATSSNPVPTSPPLDEPKNTRPTVEQRKKK